MKLSPIFITAGLVCASFMGCGQKPAKPPVSTVKNSEAVALSSFIQLSELHTVEGEGARVRNELIPKIEGLISKNDYSGLDQLADVLRKSKIQTANGILHLLTFYEISSSPELIRGKISEEVWRERLAFLKSWVSAIPTSITARVSLARFYKDYAWDARGSGYADTVTEEGWHLFKERLELARQTLIEAKKIEAKCPVWWDTMQIVALGLGWDLASYNNIFDEAVAFDPSYTSFYYNKAVYLFPRWFGQEGDWQKFAARSADKVGGEAGVILYARIGWRVHQRSVYEVFLKDSGYDWPRLKKGMEAIVKQDTDSLTSANELAYLACLARDRVCAKPLFERFGTNVDTEVWHDNKLRFWKCRIWAFYE